MSDILLGFNLKRSLCTIVFFLFIICYRKLVSYPYCVFCHCRVLSELNIEVVPQELLGGSIKSVRHSDTGDDLMVSVSGTLMSELHLKLVSKV